MNRCKFALINFPSIWGKQDITKKLTDRTYDVTQHLILPAFPWSIEIAAVDSLMVIDHKMKLDGVSAINSFWVHRKVKWPRFLLRRARIPGGGTAPVPILCAWFLLRLGLPFSTRFK